jgi:hypothetical protein
VFGDLRNGEPFHLLHGNRAKRLILKPVKQFVDRRRKLGGRILAAERREPIVAEG